LWAASDDHDAVIKLTTLADQRLEGERREEEEEEGGGGGRRNGRRRRRRKH